MLISVYAGQRHTATTRPAVRTEGLRGFSRYSYGMDVDEGVILKRLLIVLSIIAALMILLSAAGCGTASQSASLAGDETPEGILAASMDAATNISSAQADFDLTVSFNVEESQLPEEAAAFVSEPMTVSGHMAFASEPQAIDLALEASLAGEPMQIALKATGNKAYMGMGDQWYEAPAEMQQTATSMPTDSEEMQTMLTSLGLDPSTWMKGVTMVGEESLDGADVYHLQATPDLAAMVADMFKLMQSEQFSTMMGQATGSTDVSGAAGTMPALDGLEEMQQQLPEMFKNLKAEVWVDKASLNPVKISFSADIVPPAGEDAAGLNGVSIAMTLSLKEINQPVTVEAPASPKSWDEFMTDIQADPSLLGPLGSLLAGGLGSMTGDTLTTQ
jgi:hypothetical protein